MTSKDNGTLYANVFRLSQTFHVFSEDFLPHFVCFLSTVFLKYVGTDTICKWLHFKNVLLCKEVSQVTYVAACHKVCQLENAVYD